MSDMALSKAGTITSSEDRYMEWKTKDSNYEGTQWADYDYTMVTEDRGEYNVSKYYYLYNVLSLKLINSIKCCHNVRLMFVNRDKM